MIGKPERPSAVWRKCDPLNVKSAERAGGKHRIVEKISLVNFFHGHHRLCRRMSELGKLALAADPEIAVAVGHRRMK